MPTEEREGYNSPGSVVGLGNNERYSQAESLKNIGDRGISVFDVSGRNVKVFIPHHGDQIKTSIGLRIVPPGFVCVIADDVIELEHCESVLQRLTPDPLNSGSFQIFEYMKKYSEIVKKKDLKAALRLADSALRINTEHRQTITEDLNGKYIDVHNLVLQAQQRVEQYFRECGADANFEEKIQSAPNVLEKIKNSKLEDIDKELMMQYLLISLLPKNKRTSALKRFSSKR